MTTIAFDGKTMAADKQTSGGYIEGSVTKICKINGSVYAAAGGMEEMEEFFAWIKNGGDKPTIKDFEGLEAKGKNCWWYGEKLMRCKTTVPAAIGSGTRFAIGAMMAGADAKTAVNISAKLDPHTGCGIKTINTERKK
jgi:hypothetical protein